MNIAESAKYFTERHSDRAGDPGRPVWTGYGLAIVGNWLGNHDDVDAIIGCFYPPPEALLKLRLAANPL